MAEHDFTARIRGGDLAVVTVTDVKGDDAADYIRDVIESDGDIEIQR